MIETGNTRENDVDRERIKIEYIGSPYQISLSEAGQEKSLIVVDAERDWECIERIPVHIGKRYHRMELDEFMNRTATSLGINTNSTSADDNETNMKEGLSLSSNTTSNSVLSPSKGDRIVLYLTKRQHETMRASSEMNPLSDWISKIDSVRDDGIVVEIRTLDDDHHRYDEHGNWIRSNATSSHLDDTDDSHRALEDLSPESIWKEYLDHEVDRGAMSNLTAERLRQAGLELLARLTSSQTSENHADDNDVDRVLQRREMEQNARTRLDLGHVTIEGFGPFRDKLTYPLMDRGMILLRGTNMDGGTDRYVVALLRWRTVDFLSLIAHEQFFV